MANYEVPENPEYSEAIRQIEVSDLIHADVVNPIFRQLVHNDAFLKKNMPAVGTCNTAKGTAEKTVDCPDFAPYDGARIMVTFTQGSSTNYMTLNVNGTGGAAVWFPVGETRTYNNEAIAKFIAAGCAYEFIYQDGDTPKWVYCGIVSTADTLGAVKKTGDTMTGKLEIYADADPYVEAQLNVTRGGRSGRLVVSANNKFGLYDATKSKWIVESGEDGAVKLHGNAATASDASRSDALQSFQSNGTPYPRGEYVIRSIYGEDQKFWLQCLNDNSDQTRYQVAVNWAGSAGAADKSQYLRTFSASGDGHGDAYLLKCQHNLHGDGYFGFAVEGHKVEVDHALAATRDGVGDLITDKYVIGNAGSLCAGSGASAVASSTIALGGDARASTIYSIAIGKAATTSGSSAIALGERAKVTKNSSVAIGSSASVSGGYSVAIGSSASVSSAEEGIFQLGDIFISALRCKVALSVTSDERDKTDFRPITNAMEFLNELEPFTYVSNDRSNYVKEQLTEEEEENFRKFGFRPYDRSEHAKGTKKGERRRAGVSAQKTMIALKKIYGAPDYANIVNDNLHDVAPEEIPEDVENAYTVTYESFVPFLIKGIQEMSEENADLKKRLEALEKMILKTGGADGT